ncbi:type IV conjugative transfer system lipoprotein TraV [Xenorhabdus sp. XENO-1]|uniref:type IV conjugative transfer system lipoprotein TraV n=1 Tax=Xenorhabdus bovienii TaxID=40576 RepID=UPI0020CA29C9|nr:type IV conjugative transfer system lipoprotein TraV [Xenorhabdus bovienii]MCP9269143.1 type IV conjugative transfer system lipoprotein TraV [Xenorhabdus bovienii subsp. africana]
MKVLIFSVLSGALLLSGCAGTSGDFQCNATTSDACMTMEQANEKAKIREEPQTVKPGVAALPHLAEVNFRSDMKTFPVPVTAINATIEITPKNAFLNKKSVSVSPNKNNRGAALVPAAFPCSGCSTANSLKPLRVGEQIAGLWIAPYIDTEDVWHQANHVFFVVTPAKWGKPRVN